MRRRALLRAGALAATTASVPLAGCPRQQQATDESRLGPVDILNREDAPRTIEFRVEWAGDLVHESTHELAPKDGVTPSRTWPEEPGRFTVSARLADAAWRTTDPADEEYPDCFTVVVMAEYGGLGLYTTSNPHECEELET